MATIASCLEDVKNGFLFTLKMLSWVGFLYVLFQLRETSALCFNEHHPSLGFAMVVLSLVGFVALSNMLAKFLRQCLRWCAGPKPVKDVGSQTYFPTSFTIQHIKHIAKKWGVDPTGSKEEVMDRMNLVVEMVQ